MDNKEEIDSLKAEFEELLRRVSEDVSISAIQPLVQELKEKWAERVDGLAKQLEKTQTSAESIESVMRVASAELEQTRVSVRQDVRDLLKELKQGIGEMRSQSKILSQSIQEITDNLQAIKIVINDATETFTRFRAGVWLGITVVFIVVFLDLIIRYNIPKHIVDFFR